MNTRAWGSEGPWETTLGRLRPAKDTTHGTRGQALCPAPKLGRKLVKVAHTAHGQRAGEENATADPLGGDRRVGAAWEHTATLKQLTVFLGHEGHWVTGLYTAQGGSAWKPLNSRVRSTALVWQEMIRPQGEADWREGGSGQRSPPFASSCTPLLTGQGWGTDLYLPSLRDTDAHHTPGRAVPPDGSGIRGPPKDPPPPHGAWHRPSSDTATPELEADFSCGCTSVTWGV